jgi:CHAT domain-containing protein
MIRAVEDLRLHGLGVKLTTGEARRRVIDLGLSLYRCFIGKDGEEALSNIRPTTLLLGVDETILNFPWELIADDGGPLMLKYPFGRLVTTRILPRPGRDPLTEDRVVRILAVANPTRDLPLTEKEIGTLQSLQGSHGINGQYSVEVTVLARERATQSAFIEMVRNGDFDILHFAGHGALDEHASGQSALFFADGKITAAELLNLPWQKPPYLVFNSACQSGIGAGGQRLVGEGGQANGLAATFLAAGVYGYLGYFWPVSEPGALMFASTFYQSLFDEENVGLAFLRARNEAYRDLWPHGDLTAFSAVLFGDAASAERADIATAA